MTHCCPYETTYNRPVYFKFSRLCCANVGILNKLQKSVWPEVRGGNLYFNDWVVKKNHLWAAACCGSRQETLFANETTFCSQNFVSPLLCIWSVKLYVSCALIMLAKISLEEFPEIVHREINNVCLCGSKTFVKSNKIFLVLCTRSVMRNAAQIWGGARRSWAFLCSYATRKPLSTFYSILCALHTQLLCT